MSRRRIFFFASLLALPALFFFVIWSGAKERRSQAGEEAARASREFADADQLLRNRDRLQESLDAFAPLRAEFEAGIDRDLDPNRLPLRVAQVAADCGIEGLNLEPQDDANAPSGEGRTFRLTGEGTYNDVVSFLDRMERSRSRVRIDTLQLVRPFSRDGVLTLRAVVRIPRLPGMEQEEEA